MSEAASREVVNAELKAVHREMAGLRGSVEKLADQVADGARRSSEEHAEMRRLVAGLQRQLDTGVPSAEEYARTKQRLYDRQDALERRIDAVEDDNDQRRAVERWRRWALGAATGAGGLLVGVVGLVLTHAG